MIRILIADDHAVVREGLKQIVADTTDMVVSGEASTGQEVLDQVSREKWDVLVLDITMPGKSGLDVLAEVKGRRPELPVLILSVHPEDQFAVRALKAGASGYLNKESAPEELVKAIRQVFAGRKYVSPDLAERLASQLGGRTDRPLHDALSDREFQVMCKIAHGKTVSKIAEELSLSVKTIATYRERVLEKMNMETNAELTVYAIRNHLV